MNNNKMIHFFSPTEGFCGSENILAPDFVFPAKSVIQRSQVILSEPSCVTLEKQKQSRKQYLTNH